MVVTARLLVDQVSVRRVERNIHDTFSGHLMEAGKDATPVDTEGLKQSWTSDMPDEHTSQVYPSKEVGRYQLAGLLVLGTGVWGEKGAPFQGKRFARWRAHPDGVNRSGLTRGINPRRIATSINAELLRETNRLCAIGKVALDNDEYKIASYDYELKLRDAFNDGVENAVKEMND